MKICFLRFIYQKIFSFRITLMVNISYFFRIMAFKALLLPFLESVFGDEVGITETKKRFDKTSENCKIDSENWTLFYF